MANKNAIILFEAGCFKTKTSKRDSLYQPGLVDIDDLRMTAGLQQVGEVYETLSVQYPIYYNAYNLCDLHKRKKIAL